MYPMIAWNLERAYIAQEIDNKEYNELLLELLQDCIITETLQLLENFKPIGEQQ